MLFDSSVIGLENIGIGDAVYKSIVSSDIDLRKQLSSNIVLSGGTSMLNGLASRLQKDLDSKLQNVKVIALPDRKY